MGKTLYVFSSATLKRKDNTLMLQTKTHGTSYLPVETVDEILVMGEAEISKSLIELLSEKGIVVHFFDHFGKYTGTGSGFRHSGNRQHDTADKILRSQA